MTRTFAFLCLLAVIGCTLPDGSGDMGGSMVDGSTTDQSVPPDFSPPPARKCWEVPDVAAYGSPPQSDLLGQVQWNIATPSGLAGVSHAQVVAVVDVYNRAGGVGREHTLYGDYLPVRIATTFPVRALHVYRDSVATANLVSECDSVGHPTPSFVAYLGLSPTFAVADSNSRTIWIVADTIQANVGGRMVVRIEGPLLYEEAGLKIKSSEGLPTSEKDFMY